MPYNGAGTFTVNEPAFTANTVISSTAANSNNTDFATGLTTALTKNGQTNPTANLPMAGFKHTGADATSGTNAGEYMARDYWLGQRYMDNALINPSGEINQRGTTSTADDTYGGPDRWYSLNQSNPTSWAQGTNLENTTPFYQRGTQSNATPQRFGRAQIIESVNCLHMRGQSIALSARVQLSTTATLRYAILEWTGTADAVTSDVVNDWTSSTYTAGNFFVSTTTNVLGVGSIALTSATPATITVLTATVGSSMNNLIVFFWTEATAAQNVTLDIAKASLKLGTVATPYYPRSYGEELHLCLRYCHIFGGIAGSPWIATGQAYSTTNAEIPIIFNPWMRTSPTATASGNADFILRSSVAGNIDTTAISVGVLTAQSALLDATVAAGLTAGNATSLEADATPGKLTFVAEL